MAPLYAPAFAIAVECGRKRVGQRDERKIYSRFERNCAGHIHVRRYGND